MSTPRRALLTGITGQDGAYLAELLRPDLPGPARAQYRLKLMYGDLNDASSLNRILREVEPDEIYNLGAQLHVAFPSMSRSTPPR